MNLLSRLFMIARLLTLLIKAQARIEFLHLPNKATHFPFNQFRLIQEMKVSNQLIHLLLYQPRLFRRLTESSFSSLRSTIEI